LKIENCRFLVDKPSIVVTLVAFPRQYNNDDVAVRSPVLDGKLSTKQVLGFILGIWLWATPFSIMPLLGVWGRFVPEGFLTTCSFDYMTDDSSTRLFVITIFIFAFVIPFGTVIFFYSKIVGLVRNHEAALKNQARKMNVESLRSNQDANDNSAEIRVTKVGLGLSTMFAFSWIPYATVALIGAFGNRTLMTPLITMIPALTCKSVACIDPWIYAINHPRYRIELQTRMPWFCVHEPEPKPDYSMGSQSRQSVESQ